MKSIEKQLAEANALIESARSIIDEGCYPTWWEHFRKYQDGQLSYAPFSSQEALNEYALYQQHPGVK